MPIGLKGNSDGSGAIQIGGSDAISISTGLNTTFAGTITATGTVAGTTGTLYPIVSGTAVSATGTSIDFTGIPSWVRRITVMFNGVSTNGTSTIQVQIGSGSVTTSGYTTAFVWCVGGGTANTGNNSAGFSAFANVAAANSGSGTVILNLISGNTWVANTSTVVANGTITQTTSAGTLGLSGALDRVRVTTVNGTDTFDAGTINLLWE